MVIRMEQDRDVAEKMQAYIFNINRLYTCHYMLYYCILHLKQLINKKARYIHSYHMTLLCTIKTRAIEKNMVLK